MSTIKYLRNKVIIFSLFLVIGMVFFMSRKADAAHQNAAIICLIDDMSFSYKTQVFYTGEEIEKGRISQFLPNSYQQVDSVNDRIKLLEEDVYSDKGEKKASDKYPHWKVVISSGSAGRVQIFLEEDSSTSNPIRAIMNKGTEEARVYQNGEDNILAPLTFPNNPKVDATSADINRAYTIAETLGDGFNDALTFINGGESYTSVNQLISAAYGLCIINDGKTFTGPTNPGSEAKNYILYHNTSSKDGKGYLYTCSIYNKEDTSDMYAPDYTKSKVGAPKKSGEFVYAVKKGYKDANHNDVMEDGTQNQLADLYDSKYKDTTYITWEHLFLQAGMYYAEGITYANQADLYSMTALENSLTGFFRDILDGLSGLINTYTMEDLIFNNGVRGSKAFYLGTFNKNWTPYLLNMFLIFTAIAVSLVFLIIVRIILKRQLATANVFERASILEGFKDLLVSLFFIAFAWGAIKVLMIVNTKFVNIWATLVGTKTLQTVNASSIIIGGVIIKFIYFMLEIFVNYTYIIRGLVIAALIITSPLFILSINFGQKGKTMFTAWLKEIIGSIFLQSFHAFIYGLLIVASVGVRGIESIVILAALIPLTNMFKDITDSGGDSILKTAQSLSQTTGQVTGQAVQIGAHFAGKGLGTAAGFAIGGPGGAALGATMGEGVGDMAGGVFGVGSGMGLDMSGIGGGSKLTSSGFSQFKKGADTVTDGVTKAAAGAGGGMGGAMGGAGGGGIPSGGGGGVPSENSLAELRESINGKTYGTSMMVQRNGSIDAQGLSSEASRINNLSYSERMTESPVMKDSKLAEQSLLDAGPKGKSVSSPNYPSYDSNSALKNMMGNQNLKNLGNGLGAVHVDESGKRYVERAYSLSSNTASRDMNEAQNNIYNAMKEHRAGKRDGDLRAFNKKFGADASTLTRIKDPDTGGYNSTLTFIKYLDEEQT